MSLKVIFQNSYFSAAPLYHSDGDSLCANPGEMVAGALNG